MKKNLLYAMALAASLMGCSQPQDKNTEIENKVETLLHKMTLEEKLGQMNQLSPWDFEDLAKRVRKGEVGSILNVVNPEEVNKIQKIAVEESRLGIPLIVSRDVISRLQDHLPHSIGTSSHF